LYCYKPSTEINEDDQDDTNEQLSDQITIPSPKLEGLWYSFATYLRESLVLDDNIQLNLLDYIYTSMLFSDALVDPNIIAVNRVILLHGPPGNSFLNIKVLAKLHCVVALLKL
jgi:hypothetical protein